MTSPHRHKHVLVSWYTTPQYIPPFELTDHQVTVGPQAEPDQPKMMFTGWTPAGEYDLLATLESQHIRTKFDAIVVWSDASGSNRPLNLEAFDCPKILCVGDTHHMDHPLRTMIGYAQRAGFDFIVSSHNRHHLHWFVEAEFPKVAWIPALKVRHIPRAIKQERTPHVSFVGQWTALHPRRFRLLKALQYQGLPLHIGCAPREEAASAYASSVVSFNASLNGDLNLRVFEVLSAGGCMLTDRLSSHSGLDLILQEDRDFYGYSTEEELIDKTRFLLRQPNAALTVARAGHHTFTHTMMPRQQADVLLDWVFEGKLDQPYTIPRPLPTATVPLKTRLAVYEALQEAHRRLERPRVLISDALPPVFREDAADLYRLDVTVGDPHSIEDKSWDCIVAPKDLTLPSGMQPKLMISI